MGFLVGMRNTPTEITRIHVNTLCVHDKSFLGVRFRYYKVSPAVYYVTIYRVIVFHEPEDRPEESTKIVLSEFDFRISICSPVRFTGTV